MLLSCEGAAWQHKSQHHNDSVPGTVSERLRLKYDWKGGKTEYSDRNEVRALRQHLLANKVRKAVENAADDGWGIRK